MKLFHYLAYLAVRAAYGFLAILPESWVYALASGAGRLASLLDGKHRRIAESNLRLALGPDADERRVKELARQAFIHFATVVLEGPLLRRWMQPQRWQQRFEFPDALRIRELLGQGNGLLILGPHFGNWEAMTSAVGLAGFPMVGISRPLKNPYLVKYFLQSREAHGTHLVPRRGGFRDVLARLREGGVAGMMPDQNQRKRPIFVPWFGKLAATDRSPAFCSMRLGAPIVVLAAIRQGRRFRFRAEMELVESPAPMEESDLGERRFTEAVHRTIERMILRHPEQYFWLHDRYRTRPPQEGGEPVGAVESADSEEA